MILLIGGLCDRVEDLNKTRRYNRRGALRCRRYAFAIESGHRVTDLDAEVIFVAPPTAR